MAITEERVFRMKRIGICNFASILVLVGMNYLSLLGYANGHASSSVKLKSPDSFTLIGEKSFLSGYAPLNSDGSINVVVEIPTGTSARWEVAKPSGELKWEFKSNEPRRVKYLGYPGN